MSGRNLNLVQLKLLTKAKEEQSKQQAKRRKDILVLCLEYLAKNGFVG
jgi:hypothetical protein